MTSATSVCALIGIGGIAAAFGTARLVAGPRAGAIAAYALAVCGPWYGAMFNHTKDIPFAAAMMGAAYFLLRAARGLPRPRSLDVIWFGLLLGAALGMRVLGLLIVGYAGLAMIARIPRLRDGPLRDRLSFFAQSVIALAPAFLIGYAIMIAAWPWAALAPLNPVRGLIDFGEFHYQIRTLLNGHVYDMGDVPRWYVPAYLLIKLPLLMLAGAAVALLFVLWPRRGAERTSQRRLESALLVFIAVFPVACEVIDHGPAFTGLRHFLFVVPVFAALAGIGFDWLLSEIEARRRALAGGALAAIAALIVWNATILVRLHPYQYLYYNPLVGGIEGASRLYVMDYWVNIMPKRSTISKPISPHSTRRRSRPALYRGGVRRAAAVREGSRSAPAMGRGLEQGRLLHRADAHELRPRARRQGDRHHLAHGRADRRGQGPPRAGASGRRRTSVNKIAPAGGAGGRW